jgi:hypothetical protein
MDLTPACFLDCFQAKDQLQTICKRTIDNGDEDGQLAIDRVLELLRAWPVLASEMFEDYTHEATRPFHYLVLAGTQRSVIKEVHEMDPNVLFIRDQRSRQTILHKACNATAADGVLAFLVHQNPEALTLKDSAGMLPL